MMTGKRLLDELVDDLNALELPYMASKLEFLYHSPEFLTMDHMTLLTELITGEYDESRSRKLISHLKNAGLQGCCEEINNCNDTTTRKYSPSGVVEQLSSLEFIRLGYNICILGASDSGKTYLAKALAISACHDYTVKYFHSEALVETMVDLKAIDFKKYTSKMRKICNTDLVVLDDFLLHTITDEREVKVLFELLERRAEKNKSTIICSQRDPANWTSMILNDEISANSIIKRAVRHYTVYITKK